MASEGLRGRIKASLAVTQLQSSASETVLEADPFLFGHVHVGSRDSPISLADIEASHSSDRSYLNFAHCVRSYLIESHIIAPQIRIDGRTKVRYYQHCLQARVIATRIILILISL